MPLNALAIKHIERTLKHEGGWVSHPSDPGGEDGLVILATPEGRRILESLGRPSAVALRLGLSQRTQPSERSPTTKQSSSTTSSTTSRGNLSSTPDSFSKSMMRTLIIVLGPLLLLFNVLWAWLLMACLGR